MNILNIQTKEEYENLSFENKILFWEFDIRYDIRILGESFSTDIYLLFSKEWYEKSITWDKDFPKILDIVIDKLELKNVLFITK